jgi:hypothetical protein
MACKRREIAAIPWCGREDIYLQANFDFIIKARPIPQLKQEKYIFIGLLFFGFIIQFFLRVNYFYLDKTIWADQIQYFLNRDPRAFNMYLAYGHPGTTLVELGSLFHIIFGITYVNALTLSMSILISGTVAACAVLCFRIHHGSLWWVATSFTLLLGRTFIIDPPTTSVVIPFIVLIILMTWYLSEKHVRTSRHINFFLWGAITGLSAATRLDVTLLVGIPMFVLLWHRHGSRVVPPLIAGFGISFFAADPFLWFMPIRHLTDLTLKFIKHYAEVPPASIVPLSKIVLSNLIRALSLVIVSFVFSLILLWKKKLTRIIPVPIYIVIVSTTLLGLAIILTSKYQGERYLSPLIIVWDILLPLFALETFAPTDRLVSEDRCLQSSAKSSLIIGLFLFIQLSAYLFYI